MMDQSKRSTLQRFKRQVVSDVDQLVEQIEETVGERVEEWGARSKLGAETCRRLAAGFIQGHKRLGSFVGNTPNKRARDDGGGIAKSVRSFWATASKPNVVASKAGMMVRRATLAAICGAGTTWQDARDFVGGELSYGTFTAAKERRTDADKSGDIRDM